MLVLGGGHLLMSEVPLFPPPGLGTVGALVGCMNTGISNARNCPRHGAGEVLETLGRAPHLDAEGVSFHRIMPPFGVVTGFQSPDVSSISLAGVKWSCLRIDEHAFPPFCTRARKLEMGHLKPFHDLYNRFKY